MSRKLTAQEEHALSVINEHGGSYCPGLNIRIPLLLYILDSLVKKKRLTTEMTDDGVRYHVA